VAVLVKQLGDNSWDRREAAQKRLQEIGKPAVARLRAALASPDMEVSSRSKALLAEIVGQGFLGVQVRDPDDGDREGRELPADGGAVIMETLQDTPASGAGLRPGDFLYTLDGKTIIGSAGLVEMVGPIEPGTTVKLVLYRNGKKEEKLIAVGRRPKEVAR
jgi:S1-C subfamily serine protease